MRQRTRTLLVNRQRVAHHHHLVHYGRAQGDFFAAYELRASGTHRSSETRPFNNPSRQDTSFPFMPAAHFHGFFLSLDFLVLCPSITTLAQSRSHDPCTSQSSPFCLCGGWNTFPLLGRLAILLEQGFSRLRSTIRQQKRGLRSIEQRASSPYGPHILNHTVAPCTLFSFLPFFSSLPPLSTSLPILASSARLRSGHDKHTYFLFPFSFLTSLSFPSPRSMRRLASQVVPPVSHLMPLPFLPASVPAFLLSLHQLTPPASALPLPFSIRSPCTAPSGVFSLHSACLFSPIPSRDLPFKRGGGIDAWASDSFWVQWLRAETAARAAFCTWETCMRLQIA